LAIRTSPTWSLSESMNFGWDQQIPAGAYQLFDSYESTVPSSELCPELEPWPWPWQSQPLDPLQARGWHSDPRAIDSCSGTLSSSAPALSSLSNTQHDLFGPRNTLSGNQRSIETETDLCSQNSHYNMLARPNYVAGTAHQAIYVNNNINTCGYQVGNNIPNTHLHQSITNSRDPSHGSNMPQPMNVDPKTLNIGHQEQ
jgi:hypothetical protein